ncbi:autotransporter outer membrane beta-barrel domain-containing protein [Rhizobium nepotum]|uniref:autotransporter outer membrane beta-barrel domain-containing protein n=1 Tax=Rhizobium nepotum TaxID=1035271 RepID=UPI0006962520|nr:autotransporter domain-containing protein [Rhizobium nepotum]
MRNTHRRLLNVLSTSTMLAFMATPSLAPTFGMRASTDFLISDVKASARGMIGWRHAYGDVTPGLSQAFAGGDVFSIAGVPVARDAAVLEAGLDFAVTPSATVGVSYQGQLAADARDHSVKAQLNVRF